MNPYSLTHRGDAALLRGLAALVVRDRATTARLLAHIAEVDARRLYLPAGYASMHVYCVDVLSLSDDAAYKRIQAARAARDFPALFAAVEAGDLNLTSICLIAPHLSAAHADELIAAASRQPNTRIREWLARRFPGAAAAPGVPNRLRPLPAAPATQLAVTNPESSACQLAAQQVGLPAATPPTAPIAALPAAPPPAAPSPPAVAERFLLQLTIPRGTHDKLRHAQALLRHAVPSGNLAQVLDRALDALIARCEKRRFAATDRPRPRRVGAAAVARRTIPAHVRREVWQRDQGRCTFVGAGGHRCDARGRLEFDHVAPVARGGRATPDGMRLRCRAHNQLEAERVFGREFMEARRAEARAARRPGPDCVHDGMPMPGLPAP